MGIKECGPSGTLAGVRTCPDHASGSPTHTHTFHRPQCMMVQEQLLPEICSAQDCLVFQGATARQPVGVCVSTFLPAALCTPASIKGNAPKPPSLYLTQNGQSTRRQALCSLGLGKPSEVGGQLFTQKLWNPFQSSLSGGGGGINNPRILRVCPVTPDLSQWRSKMWLSKCYWTATLISPC